MDIYSHVPAVILKPCTCDKLVHMSVPCLFDDKLCAREVCLCHTGLVFQKCLIA